MWSGVVDPVRVYIYALVVACGGVLLDVVLAAAVATVATGVKITR